MNPSSVVSVLSRYTMNPPDQISVSLVDLHEADFSSEVTESNGAQGVFATFITEPNATSISFELGARFAAMLVDRMLGGDGVPPDNLRSLTRTERRNRILCLSAAGELTCNRRADAALPLLATRPRGDRRYKIPLLLRLTGEGGKRAWWHHYGSA